MFTYNKKMCPYGLESTKKTLANKKNSNLPTSTLFWDPMYSETEVLYFLALLLCVCWMILGYLDSCLSKENSPLI